MDIPLERGKFTWYRDNGRCCSRIDRFLPSWDLMDKWKNLVQIVLKRKASDHTTILLKEEVKDWGSKPFKFLSCWLKEKGFKEMAEEEWRSYKMDGWSGFVLKEKLKCIKEKIRLWHKEKFASLERKID